MIHINLLPHELRRAERTSPKVFAAALGGILLVCCSLGWFATIYFGELGRLEVESKGLSDTLAAKLEFASYHDALAVEREAYEQRAKTIRQIGASRMLWTEFMDQLLDVVNNDGNSQRHLAWFSGIQVADGTERAGPTVSLPAQVQGDAIKRVADFYEDIENSAFARDLVSKSAPGGELKMTPKREPVESFAFTLQLGFKPAQEWQRNTNPSPVK